MRPGARCCERESESWGMGKAGDCPFARPATDSCDDEGGASGMSSSLLVGNSVREAVELSADSPSLAS